MSAPAHLWLEDENGSPIVGCCAMPLRLGSIELKSFSHGVTIPVDPSWGKLTGTRVHRPITIVKEFDQTTPLLYRAVCEGRTMKKATIKMYRILESGIEAEYFNIILENVKFTTVAPSLSPRQYDQYPHRKRWSCAMRQLPRKYTEGNILYRDSWNDRCCA
ncbi:type VI secretion system tube protein Hcp [Enterobacter hormaechei]|nr:type VI secretion system tube protein Hcp [Enterobacter hormaechei]MBD3716980.1 type VI secretion system tube protein Hcp [Enterobacter hormaechei]